jgi:phosphoglycerate dehydrogenase-like enzyme
MRPRLAFAMAPAKTLYVFDDDAMARLAALCDVPEPEPLTDLSTEHARRLLAETDILVTAWGCPRITPAVVAAAPRLKLIAHAAGTVKYHLDPAVYAAGIAVTNAVDANAIPVAEFTLAMIILANKRTFEFRDLYRADPSRGSSQALMDTPIGNYRRTVGIVGASHIGRRVIDMLRLLDGDVLLHDPYVTAADPVSRSATLVGLDELIARSDIVSLHAPSLPETRHMIGARQLAAMRDGATLINTARGALVDEAALIAELRTGRISAIVDVTDPEIPPAGSPLYELPNLFLTPHIAGAVGTERSRLGGLVVDEIERFIAGQPLQHAVSYASLGIVA